MKIFFALYSFLWTLAIPFLSRKKRLAIGLEQRLVKKSYSVGKNNKTRVLIYAASGGEAFLACTFISKQNKADVEYYCFSWTKEGVDSFNAFAKKNENLTIKAFYAPFDKPSLIEQALREIAPSYCYIMETEVWFGLLNACKNLEIPFSFINARMTEKSYNNLSKLSFILKKMPLDKVYALSKEDGERFVSLFSSKSKNIEMHVQENLKFDQARALLRESLAVENISHVPFLLFASVREEEEGILLACVKKIQEKFPDICIIICPKHIERAEFWKNNLEKSLLVKEENISISSVEAHFSENKKLYIWNTFGDLKHLYALADIAFVGASLVSLGGQNFLEPLACGTKTFVGKYLKNFKWVFEKEPDLRHRLLKQVETVDELYNLLVKELDIFNRQSANIEKSKRKEEFALWLGKSPD